MPIPKIDWLQMPGGVELLNCNQYDWITRQEGVIQGPEVRGVIRGHIVGEDPVILSDTDIPTSIQRMLQLCMSLGGVDYNNNPYPFMTNWFMIAPSFPANQHRLLNLGKNTKITMAQMEGLTEFEILAKPLPYPLAYNLTEPDAQQIMAALQACTGALPLTW
jgi:hypothetical protein